jgi:transposase
MDGLVARQVLPASSRRYCVEGNSKERLKSAEAIGVRVGRVVNKHKVAKHFVLDIREGGFDFCVDEEKVAAEAALDGIYVVRTNVPKSRMSRDDTVRSYKSLSQVERAFRTFKSVDLKVRPIHHHNENRVRAHIFLCMLAYYVEWHMVEALRPLLFTDEDQTAKATRDPVAPAKRSRNALDKTRTKKNDDAPADVIIETTPDPIQTRALELLRQITV